MSLCGILLMTLITPEKSIIRERRLPSFHGLNSIRIFTAKSYGQAKILSSCHGTRNSFVFPKNRRIPEIICLFTPILQGGIAFFAVFAVAFRFFRKIARNGNKSVVLLDLKKDMGFPRKSLISRNNLLPFYKMVCSRIFFDKSHDSNSELMSSRGVGIIRYVLRKIGYSRFQINVY